MDRFLIAPLEEGLRTDLKAWMIPDEAYAELNNAYIFRGRLKKRAGTVYTGTGGQYTSRLRVLLPTTMITLPGGSGVGTTDGAGAASGTLAAAHAHVGQKFSIGSEVFTITSLGTPSVMTTTGAATTHTINTTTGAYVFAGATPATQIYFYPDGGGHDTTIAVGSFTGVLPGNKFLKGQQFSMTDGTGTYVLTVPSTGSSVTLLSTGGGYAGTLNTTTGAYTFTYTAVTAPNVYYYPLEPVMGLTQYEKGTVHNQTAYAFDTQFAYRFSGGSWVKESLPFFSSTNKNFVATVNWEGQSANDVAMFASNFNYTVGAGPTGDRMIYYDGTNWLPWLTTTFKVAGDTILSAKVLAIFKDRLLLLNTIESNAAGTTSYACTNRVRISQRGSPLDAAAFLEPSEVGWIGGNFIDGPVEEDIIGCELIRDRCIVFFERSTWELAYTGNEALPFIWQQINTELGSEAQFSVVPFDKYILCVGPNGFLSCNGMNVERMDEKIPDEVFNIRIKNEGMSRVAGVRDYYSELVYWTYPTDDNKWAQTYPNKCFVYNYRNNTWAINDDTFTAFGYWEQQTDITWADITDTWAENNQTWSSNVNAAQFRHVIAGNQHGYIVELTREVPSQAASLSITSLTYNSATESVTLYVKDHNYAIGDYINISGVVSAAVSGIYQIYNIDNKDEIILSGFTSDPITTAYKGGGVIARVPNISILSKEWNPYKKDNRGFNLMKIDFGVKRTASGQVTIDYNPSHTGVPVASATLETSPYALVPLEQQQRLLWHSVYFNGEGDSVQIRIYFSDTQMKNASVAESDFTIEGLVLYMQPTRVL